MESAPTPKPVLAKPHLFDHMRNAPQDIVCASKNLPDTASVFDAKRLEKLGHLGV